MKRRERWNITQTWPEYDEDNGGRQFVTCTDIDYIQLFYKTISSALRKAFLKFSAKLETCSLDNIV